MRRTWRKVLLLIMALLLPLACVLTEPFRTIPSPTTSYAPLAEGTPPPVAPPVITDQDGKAIVADSQGLEQAIVQVEDEDSRLPASGVEVYFVQQGSGYLAVAIDPEGRYLASWSQGSLEELGAPSSPLTTVGSFFPSSPAYAQPLPLVLLLLKVISKVSSLQDLIAYLQNPPELVHWGVLYSDRCWTGEQLANYVGAGGLILPGIDEVAGVLAGGMDEIAAAIFALSQHVIEEDAEELLLGLDRPVRIRTYHLGIPALGMVPVGWCQVETTPPAPLQSPSPTIPPLIETVEQPTPSVAPSLVPTLAGPPGWIAFHSSDGLSIMAATGAPQTPPLLPEPRIWYSSWSPDGEWLAISVPPGWLVPGGDVGKAEIFAVRRDGTDLTQITRDNKDNDHPSWSPDGEWIAYSSFQDPYHHLFIVSRDGSRDIQLTFDPIDDRNPSWSPDGEWIAFERNGKLCLVTSDGGRLECPQAETEWGPMPIPVDPFGSIAWSPDAEWLALDGIRIVRPDGSNLTQLTESRGSQPTWSPDGEWIAFFSSDNWQGEVAAGIWVMRKDGSQRTHIAESAGSPSWSPSTYYPDLMPPVLGGWIAYSDFSQICVMQTNGWDHQCLTSALPGENALEPSWSPDGEWIAFDSYREVEREVFIIRRDGSEERRLTFGSSPAWSPDGEWIAFTHDFRIHIIRPDGSQDTVLSDFVTGQGPQKLFWSPDGEWIGFKVTSKGLFLAARDGGDIHPFLDKGASSGAWSPDGQWIAFECRPEPQGEPEICIARKDGTETTRLTYTPGGESDPCWSPDGEWIAFAHRFNRICVMRADGTDRICLRGHGGSAIQPSWSR